MGTKTYLAWLLLSNLFLFRVHFISYFKEFFMCGIFGYIGTKKDSATIVLAGLKRLEYRGYDSWGVAVVPDKKVNDSGERRIAIKKQVGKIGDGSVSQLPPGTLAFGHTRWATHGGVTKENAHPHLDCSGKISVIHNGIFENYESVKEELLKKGHAFLSETDTEVIAHLIEEEMESHAFAEAVRHAFMRMEGLNAVIAIHSDERNFVAAGNGSPLVLGFGTGENYLASDPAALLPHTKDVYFLEDQEMALVDDTSIRVFDVHTRQEKVAIPQHLTWDQSQTEKGDYQYFMEKEIYEQPLIIDSIAASATTNHQSIASLMKEAHDVYFVGCGTASYAGMAGYYLFSKIAYLHTKWAVGSEFSAETEFVSKNSLVLALSQSGETMDILEPLKKVQAQGASIVALVNVLGSSLYRMSDEKILIGAGPEQAVASTKAFTGKIAHLVLLAYALANRLEEGKSVVSRAAKSSSQVLSKQSVHNIKSLAKQLKNTRDLYILGRGISYPLSLETALKIKEISYIHAEGLATGELKHGTLALIEKGTPCIAFLPDDETYSANLAGAMEVKARGGYVIGVSFKRHEVFDYFIEVTDAKEATIIPNAIVAQLLACFLTLEKGLDPDMPRNLAKSVTVK